MLAVGRAEAPGAATIVNAMATGRGAAFAIDLKVQATVIVDRSGEFKGQIEGNPDEDAGLVELCARKVLEKAGEGYGARVRTTTELPIARGLSSSSAASNATVLAAASCLEKLGHPVPGAEELLNMGIEASLEVGVTVTGAFDDASASFYGGAVITDNMERRILRREAMLEMPVAVFVPPEKAYSGKVDTSTMKLLGRQVAIAHEEALKGSILDALTLNGLIYCAALGYDPSPAVVALKAGAAAAGLTGKGPAFVAIGDDVSRVRQAWSQLGGTVILTKTNNSGSRVLE